MINFDYNIIENIKEHLNWLQIPGHPYTILKIGGSGSGKTSALLNLNICQPDTDKIYLYVKDPCEAKDQLVINKREGAGLEEFHSFKSFIEYSHDMDNIYENIEECNPNKEPKILILFDDTIVAMFGNKKLNPTVTELSVIYFYLLLTTKTYSF